MTRHNHATLAQDTDSEDALVATAQEALNQCRWVVGECAAKWTERYARGRTDADFGILIGLSGDQVYQRRRVWEMFAQVRQNYMSLKWSHFYAAIAWDDAEECLQWAEEMRSTVAEMKAWRRARRGEDLTTAAVDDFGTGPAGFLSTETAWVQDPGEFRGDAGRGGSRVGGSGGSGAGGSEEEMTLAGVARQVEGGGEYSPFRQGAGAPAPKEQGSRAGTPEHAQPTAEQLVKRMTSTLERCTKILTPEFRREFRKLPEPVRERLVKSVNELHAQITEYLG